MLNDLWEWKLDAEGIAVLVVGVVVGGLITAPTYYGVTGGIYPSPRSTLAGWALCSLGLSLLRPTWAATGVALGSSAWTGLAGAAVGSNLFPIGAVLALAFSGRATVGGALGGVALRHLLRRRVSPLMMRLAVGVVVTGAGIVGVWPAMAMNRHVLEAVATNEESARVRLADLVEAQRNHRLRHSAGLYACTFDDLNHTFERREYTRSVRDIGWAKGYSFRLTCPDQTRQTFRLDAHPERRQWFRSSAANRIHQVLHDGDWTAFQPTRGADVGRWSSPTRLARLF